MSVVEKTLYTTEEFEAYAAQPENRERLLELIYGEMREKMPTEEHGLLAVIIATLLLMYAEPRKLGYATVETRYQLPKDTHNSRRPDVSFRRAESPVVTQGAVPRMPDLAVEVQSPDDSPRELREKAAYYLQNGSSLVWLVFSKTRSVEVCTRTEAGIIAIVTVEHDGALSGGDVLPEFTLPLRDIFDRPIWQAYKAGDTE